jgi:polyhydroxyalkanoate synthesis regulator phasin
LQKKTQTLVSVLLAGTLLLGLVSVAAADSTTSTSVSQSIKTLCQKGYGAQTPAQMETELQAKLKTLVDKGTITQAQADKVVAYLKKMQETRKADFAKVKNMTQAERKAYMEQNRDKFKNPLAQLVTDKVLSQDQADAIAQLMPMHRGKGMKGDLAANQTKMKEILSGLVDKGTLTQKQMDSIITAMDKMHQERQADMEKIKNMTPEERQTYIQQLKSKKTSPIEQLVKDNVITSEQADAIRDAMPQRSGQQCR